MLPLSSRQTNPHQPSSFSEKINGGTDKPAPIIPNIPQLNNPLPLDKRTLSIQDSTLTDKGKKEKGAWNWLYRHAPNSFVRFGIKAGEKIFFNTSTLHKSRKANLDRLEELTHSAQLLLFLGGISPMIVQVIQKNAVDEGDQRLQNLLNGETTFLIDLVDSMLPKILVNIVEQMEANPPVSIEMILAHLIGIVTNHFNEARPIINRIESEMTDPAHRKSELHKVFIPLVDELLRMGFPQGEQELPLVTGLRGYAWNQLRKEVLPSVLLKLYHLLVAQHDHSKMDQLRQMKGGELLFNLCEGIGNKIPDHGSKILTDQAGSIVEKISSRFPPFDKLSGAFKSDLKSKVEKSTTDNKCKEEWSLIQADLRKWLEGQIVQMAQSQDPALQQLWKFVADGVKPVLAHILINLAEGSEREDLFQTVIRKFLTPLGNFIEVHGDEILKAYTILQEKGVEPSEDKDLIELFHPLAASILKQMGMDKLVTRPLPAILGEKFWEGLETVHLPQLLIKIYAATSGWQNKAEDYRASIQKVTKTNYLPEAVRILTMWIGDSIPSHLASGSNELAIMIYEFAKKHLVNTQTNQSVEQFLNDNEAEIKKLLKENMMSLAMELQSDGQALVSGKGYLEALLLKAFSSLITHIDSLENPKGSQYREEFMVKTTLTLLNTINQHVSKINEIKRKHRKASAQDVDPELMLQEFGIELNPAIPFEMANERKSMRQNQKIIDMERKKISKTQNVEIIAASRIKIKEAQARYSQAKAKIDDHRLKTTFVPFVQDFVKMLNLENPVDLPMPLPMWKAFCKEALPMLTMEIFDDLSKPSRRNQLLLTALESFEEALVEPSNTLKEPEDSKDNTQKDLDSACGQLVLHIFQMVPIRLLPNAIVKAMFKLARIQDVSGERIGRVLRTKLESEWTGIKILDECFKHGIPNLYPGGWEGESQKAQFVFSNRHLDMPMSAEEKEIFAQRQWEKNQKLAETVKHKMVKVSSKAIASSMIDLVRVPWKRFHKTVNRFLSNHLGFTPLIVKQFLDYIFHQLFFTLIGNALLLLTYPARKPISLIAEFYVDRKLRSLFNTMQMDIHETLYYNFAGNLKEALKPHPLPHIKRNSTSRPE